MESWVFLSNVRLVTGKPTVTTPLHLISAQPGQEKNYVAHNKWDLVGYSGGLPGLENAVKNWGRQIGPICFSV